MKEVSLKVYNTKDGEFPKDGQWVLGYVVGRPWVSSDPDKNYFWKVVRFTKGISEEDRQKMSPKNVRKTSIRNEDVWGNNLVPWAWEEFGPGSYFGQEIEVWVELPAIRSLLDEI